MPETPPILHRPEKKRFELTETGKTAFSEYLLAGQRIFFTHTEVPPELEGQGIASQLARAGLEYARAKQLQVAPLCPFVAGYMSRHDEYLDLLAPGYRITQKADRDP